MRLRLRHGLLLLLGGLLAGLPACGAPAQSPSQAIPERARTLFLSHILFSNQRQAPSLQRRRAEAALDLVRRGTPFAEVARAQSEDLVSRAVGGVLGCWRTGEEGMQALDGAAQVMAEGQVAGPVETTSGWHLLLRHPYEEGRQAEAASYMPTWGVVVAHGDASPGSERSREEARALAQQLLSDLRAGRISLAEACAQHPTSVRVRPDGWMGLVSRTPFTGPMWDLLARTPPGTLAGPLESDQGIALCMRTPLLRCIVRHVLVQHAGAEGTDIQQSRTEQAARARAEEALARVLAAPGEWERVVQSYSDEVATRDDLGSLGCVGPQELPPELEAAVLETAPGTFCRRVVRTARGWHVVWRVD